MAKFFKVEDVKPVSGGVIDNKPLGRAVVNTKPNMRLIKSQTIEIGVTRDLGRGMSVGPGWFMYVTYPENIQISI